MCENGGLATQVAILIGNAVLNHHFVFPLFSTNHVCPVALKADLPTINTSVCFQSHIMFWILDMTYSRVSHSLYHLQPTRSLVFTWKTIVFSWKIAMFHHHKTRPRGSAPWFCVPRATRDTRRFQVHLRVAKLAQGQFDAGGGSTQFICCIINILYIYG